VDIFLQKRGLTLKEKITEKSIQLFDQKGFSETSIQDIVDSIGVTKGTFYYYFSSKEELLMDIHLRYIDYLLVNQDEILKDESQNCKNKLFAIVHMLISNIKTQGASAKVFFREMRNLSDERLSEIIPKRDLFRLNIEKLLEKGKQNGEFRADLKTSIVTFGILGAANWSYQWFNPEGKVSDREVAEIFTEMILKGIEM
jgi:AcrR family transcriptional regulator